MKNLKVLYTFIKPYQKNFYLAVCSMLIATIAMGIMPSIEGMITTQIYEDVINSTHTIHIQFSKIVGIMAVLLGIYIIKTIGQIICSIYLTSSIQNAMRDLRNALQEKIMVLPVSYFDQRKQGDILSIITNDVDTISTALQQVLTQVISGILNVIIAILMMFYLNTVMACVALLIIPGMMLITTLIVKHSQRRFKAQQEALGALNGAINELYSGYHEILLYNHQEASIKQFDHINQNLQINAKKAAFMSSVINPLNSLVTYLVIGACAVIGSYYAINQVFDPGKIQAFIRYIWQLNDPLSQVSSLSNQIQSSFAAITRVTDFLNEEEQQQLPLATYDLKQMKGNIEFKNVCFGYDEKEIIHDLNIKINAGDMIAIVGPTGAGKTTIINLLMRFYEAKEGEILIDGIDIKKMKRQDLRELISMVLQDTWLFHGSIYDNIRYGRLDARKDEVIDSARKGNVHHFVKTLTHGYDTMINEDASNVSLGEKQLMTIARAFLKNPKILILDEATSSVDTRIEKMLQDAMNKVRKDRTSFVIAHRLSTIRSADLILVLDQGKIIEYGNHEQLIQKQGFYYQLYQAQFENN